ncbi:Glutathione-dependent formaldehyde-activating enzyme [Shimia sp. SK013]|uniref:GFA family protein n=1 Tax=Shimia sp. SK013 TaxID=1389006 RepID=UPI0006CE0B1E|nr:GFA family protein [Shimia sp. SK013]KPA21718.1 Glutathione-dependent formaldehyde-activating enzyme [Shimia sp. SK013]
MPSDGTTHHKITGRCYCGAVLLVSDHLPATVAYCHCSDCRRWTGAPLPAFAAFGADHLSAKPDQGTGISHTQGVTRWNCNACGSPLMARFEYLPDQVYVPLGLIDQAADLAPALHCHADAAYPWLHLQDDAPRVFGSARNTLNDAI